MSTENNQGTVSGPTPTPISNTSASNISCPTTSATYVSDGNQVNAGILAGVLVPLLLIVVIIVVLILLYRKEIWRPNVISTIIEKINFDDVKSDTGWWGIVFGRRHPSKAAVSRNEVRQYATVDENFEHAFCRTIEEGQPDDSSKISYTLSEESQYDELNKSHTRRVIDSSLVETYEHAHHLPPDLAKDYDSADANALFPKRFQFERPVSDSHNTYSHLAKKKNVTAQENDDCDNNESSHVEERKMVTGNDVEYDNNLSRESITDTESDAADLNKEIYDTEMADVILNRSQRKDNN